MGKTVYQLAPSLLAADFNILGNQLQTIEECGVRYLHIDVMDGVFVPQISLGMPVIESIRKNSGLVFDVHLMIVEPERYVDTFLEDGADILTFHYEATQQHRQIIDKIRAAGRKAGMVIKPATPVESVLTYLKDIDQLLIMTVEPGFGGQKFMEDMLPKIRKAREVIDEQNLGCDIEVDGGINKDTIRLVLDAGANIIVSGSSVFRGDLKANAQYYKEVLDREGQKD